MSRAFLDSQMLEVVSDITTDGQTYQFFTEALIPVALSGSVAVSGSNVANRLAFVEALVTLPSNAKTYEFFLEALFINKDSVPLSGSGGTVVINKPSSFGYAT